MANIVKKLIGEKEKYSSGHYVTVKAIFFLSNGMVPLSLIILKRLK